MVRCTGACLGIARSQRSRLLLAPVAPRILSPRDLSQMCKYETPIKNAMGAVQRVVYYMLMHNLTILALQAIYYFTPSVFSILIN
jgi:hypothetical protein